MKYGDIILRAVEPEDLELLYKWENDVEFWIVSNTITPFSRYTLRRYIENSHRSIYETGQLRLMIVLKQNNECIGAVDLFDFDPFHSRAGLGILIAAAEHRRKGYARMALTAVTDYCFNVLKLHQLYCNIPENNLPSLELFKAAGFQIIGLKKDWLKSGDSYVHEYLLQLIG